MRSLRSLAMALAALAAPLSASAVTHTFTFRDTLAPREGGPSLVPVYNGGPTATVLTEAMTGFVGGSFVTQTITANACASQPMVRGWRFPARGGLRHPNTAPMIASGSYTLSMLVRFTTVTGGYLRLIDFSDSTLDTGIYVLGNDVSFYPVGTFAMNSFASGRDTFVTLTRDAATRVVNLYINGAPAGTYTDTMGLYAPSSGALYFFLDNTTGSAAISESGEGTVAYLQVSDAPITPAQVTASLGEICMTVRCGDGVLSPGEGCDSGMAMGSATCDPSCRIRSGNPCNGAAPGATGNASCASGMCITAGAPAPGRCGDCTSAAQCGGATPVCGATNTCVACGTAGASACPAGTVCAASGRCVQCASDAQCAGTTPRCDASGRCVACNAPGVSDCPSGTMCAPDGACVACIESRHCPSETPVCDLPTRTCVRCSATATCDAPLRCDLARGACVACVDDSHCAGETPACHPTQRRCVGCGEVMSDPCAAGLVCERTSGRCVAAPDAAPDVAPDIAVADAAPDLPPPVDAAPDLPPPVDAAPDLPPPVDAAPDLPPPVDAAPDVAQDVPSPLDAAMDSTSGADGGDLVATNPPGCGCRAGDARAARGASLTALAFVLALVRRRRRR